MKKKILFMLINMNVGGTEKALLNMISEIPKEKYEITIFMLEEYGGFLEFIPSDVNIEYFNGYQKIKDILNKPPRVNALSLLKKGRVIRAFFILLLNLITKILDDRSLLFRYTLRKYPKIEKEYDVAVAYDGPMDFISYFILNKVKANKKIQWIHFDVTKIGFNKTYAKKIYNKFEKVFVVSQEAKMKLLDRIPSLDGKTEVFFNILSEEVINSQVKEGKGFNDNFDGLRILTVGRLSDEKGQDLAIRALSKLINDGFKVRWYCIGEGNSRSYYEKLIKELNLKEHFILLGSDPNPYQYIDQCDIYVQPSRYEGYCITLLEARCLKKPIVATKVNGVKEQIRTEENGLIVGIDANEIYEGVKKLIVNKKLREQFTHELASDNFSSSIQMNKLFEVTG